MPVVRMACWMSLDWRRRRFRCLFTFRRWWISQTTSSVLKQLKKAVLTTKAIIIGRVIAADADVCSESAEDDIPVNVAYAEALIVLCWCSYLG